jgi:hypothetical protein
MNKPTRPTRATAVSATLALAAVLLAAAGCAGPAAHDHQTSADALYPLGTARSTVETQHGPSRFIWVGDEVPDDEFAAATMREMISLGKPRPRAYQVFLVRRADAPGAYDRDYVFYNDLNRVVYVARRNAQR